MIAACKYKERSRSRGQLAAGFTLVENLVSVGILGIMMVSFYGAYSFGFKLIRVTQENVRADQILVEKLETIRVYDWSKVTNGTYIPTNFTAQFFPGATVPGATYTGSIAIASSALSESYSNSIRQVTIALAWNSSGLARSRSMSTFVSRYGIQTYKP